METGELGGWGPDHLMERWEVGAGTRPSDGEMGGGAGTRPSDGDVGARGLGTRPPDGKVGGWGWDQAI